jgi:hypothetical protein
MRWAWSTVERESMYNLGQSLDRLAAALKVVVTGKVCKCLNKLVSYKVLIEFKQALAPIPFYPA